MPAPFVITQKYKYSKKEARFSNKKLAGTFIKGKKIKMAFRPLKLF